ncbi:TolC family protein [Vreelandella utahensis]|uniref:TolC family protein n=1 Tax=Vreelandella halophila TaxID=86177 RepID=UPI0009863F4C|nr:TolC family protein [Halomonas utahensis]
MIKAHHRALTMVAGLVIALPTMAVPLDSLLERMENGPEVQAAQAEQRALTDERRDRADERGWSLFGGATAGRFQELEPNAGRVDYTGYGAQVGLRYPLLGTLRARTEALVRARTAEQRQKHQRQLAETEQRLRLRMTYIDWWEAQQYQRLCQELVPLAEDELALVRQRAGNQDLRTSEQMLLEQRWSRRLNSCRRRAEREAELHRRLEAISGVSMPANARAESEPLPLEPASAEQWQPLIQQHPLMAAQQSTLEAARRTRHDRWYHDVDADFTLAQQFDWRDDIPGTGTGLVAGFRFEVPLGALSGRAGDGAATERFRAARHELTATRDRLSRNLSDALEQYRSALAETRDQQRQVKLSRRVEGERQARDSVDDGDGFMALRLARVQSAGAMHDFIRSWRNAWQEEAQLRLLASHAETDARYLGEQGLPWPGADARGSDKPVQMANESGRANDRSGWSRAVYVWDSTRLLAPDTRASELTALQEAGFDTLHIGLSANQLSGTPELAKRLRETLAAAHERGLRVTLLLGEPGWIQPDQRSRLRDLIRRLAGLEFDGLHLDLEVEQLGWPVADERLEDWLATVAMAKRASPWPISLVSHRRWFSPDPEGLCIPCRLSDMGIRSITLMIYTTNEASMLERTRRIAAHWPSLRFQVAQSAETDLAAENSWHGTPADTLQALEQDWQRTLMPAGVAGIAWQDWTGYRAIADEEQP